jgi:chemotaxis protein MotA
MFAIIGIVIVFGSVLGGYLMEHGNVKVLVQPAELVVIGGAAIGTVLIANPLHILKQIVGGVVGVFGGSKFTKQRYLESLKMMYELLNKARREGLMALEADVEDPGKSPRRIDLGEVSASPSLHLWTLIRYNERFVLYSIQKETIP